MPSQHNKLSTYRKD
jgi:hypothetical protein